MSFDPSSLLVIHMVAKHLPRPVHEYRFAPPRRFRFDFAWPTAMLAVEVDGGGWVRGRHHRPKGYAHDCEKGNLAVEAGWRVLHYVPEQIESGAAIKQIERVLHKALKEWVVA